MKLKPRKIEIIYYYFPLPYASGAHLYTWIKRGNMEQ